MSSPSEIPSAISLEACFWPIGMPMVQGAGGGAGGCGG
jgi:hypothetical protein